MRNGTKANDDRSRESKKGSAGNSFHDPEIDPADGHHDSSRDPKITPADGNVDSSLDTGIDGKPTSKVGRKTERVDSYNRGECAKARGKARGNQSGNDDAVESSDYHNNSIPGHETHGSGRARKPLVKNCKCLIYIPIYLHCLQYNQIECFRFFFTHQFNFICF